MRDKVLISDAQSPLTIKRELIRREKVAQYTRAGINIMH